MEEDERKSRLEDADGHGEQGHRLTRLACIQKVTPRQSKPRVSRTKGHLSKRTAFVRDIVKEVSGYAFPHHHRMATSHPEPTPPPPGLY
jgi:hypothetical protein